MQWRLVGPFRGGRVIAVAGDPADPLTAYFGACSGGVWKTIDAGASWRCISDGYFQTASVGAIAVADSDNNIIYAGMGEACIRGNVTHGDGVYRSDDAGDTWVHRGLESTLHISRLRVDPHDPDLVYVAAFGHAFGPHPDRGVYRTRDGGLNWEKTLYVNETTGACDLSMDPRNPRILYAAMWEAQRSPWSLVSGGEGSGIYKTTNGGDSWSNLTDNPGLPSGIKGRIGIAVSPANPDRVWALIEAVDGGLYRSDNGGKTWMKLTGNPDLMQRPWYYMHIFADPKDANTVYVCNLRMWKSTDGGSTFSQMPTPHGDNHDLWIDPENPRRMVQGNDGGACVSLDAGITWSSIYNQPTAQFYHVTTDTQFPYRIYGAQQDNTTLSVPSYSDRGLIMADDTYPVGGSESGYIAVRPDNPNIIYAGGYASRMTRYDHASRQQVDTTVWPDDPIGYGADSMKYRFQWTFPIMLSPHDPDVLYVTGNHVHRSVSGGQQFEVVSPDLTRGDPETLLPSGGEITKDNVSTEYYATIFAFTESPVTRGVLWTGSDDGLINVSRDGGDSWSDVTPQVLPDWTLISIIEASPHDEATAYVAATRYKLDDFTPYLIRTTDFGATWELITNGIHDNDFTRVIREDPVVPGLLYAGTESGVYISWDNGDNWSRIEHSNLPVVPIHDMVVHDSDLILATHGRSFWCLDDLSPVRNWPDIDQSVSGSLFPVRPAVRTIPESQYPAGDAVGYKTYLSAGGNQALGIIERDDDDEIIVNPLNAGSNPPGGVIVNYWLSDAAPEEVTISFHDPTGETIRTFSSDDDIDRGQKVRSTPGFHRFVWDMRYPDARKIGNDPTLSAYWGGSGIGPVAVPGLYEVRLNTGDHSTSQQFSILADPRISASQDDLQAQFDLLQDIRNSIDLIHETVLKSRNMRAQIESWENRLQESNYENLANQANEVAKSLRAAEDELVEARSSGAADIFNYPPKLNRKFASLQSTVAYGDSRPPDQSYEVYQDLHDKAERYINDLNTVIEKEIGALNLSIAEADVDPIG